MVPTFDIRFTGNVRDIAIERYQVTNDKVRNTYLCLLPGCESVQYAQGSWDKHFVNFHDDVLEEIKVEVKNNPSQPRKHVATKHEPVQPKRVATSNFNAPQQRSFLDEQRLEEDITKEEEERYGASYTGKSKKARRAHFDADDVVIGVSALNTSPKKSKHHKSVKTSAAAGVHIKSGSSDMTTSAASGLLKPAFVKTSTGVINRLVTAASPLKPQTLWRELPDSHFPRPGKSDAPTLKHNSGIATTASAPSSAVSYFHGCDFDFDAETEATYTADQNELSSSPVKTGTKSVRQALAEGYAVAECKDAAGRQPQGQQQEVTAAAGDAYLDSGILRAAARGGRNDAGAGGAAVAGFTEYRGAKGKVRYVPTNEDPWW